MKNITVKDGSFVDASGKAVTLRGINMVCKEKSRGYVGDYGEEQFALLESLGFNLIRLGIFWDGVEPAPGAYDDCYLSKIEEISKRAEKHGIAVFLDMHQDLFSAEFEDGAPGWATLTDGETYEKTELWSEAYLTSPAVQRAFDNFWGNAVPEGDTVGIRDRFVAMWKHVAEFFKEDSNVIGVDVFNEPFPGSAANGVIGKLFESLVMYLMTNPEKLVEILGEGASMVTPDNIVEVIMGIWMKEELKAKLLCCFDDSERYAGLVRPLAEATLDFDREVLTGFYREIRDAIRVVDPELLLFIEANYFCNTGVPSNVVPPVDENGKQDAYLVYGPHGYDLMVDTESYSSDCFTRLDVIFEAHREYAAKYGLPTIVGEWGCYPNANEAQKKEAQYLLEKFERLGFGNTYYDFSTFEGNPIQEVLRAK